MFFVRTRLDVVWIINKHVLLPRLSPAAEGSDPPGEHPVPTRPLLPGRPAARGLHPGLPREEAVRGPLRPTGVAPAHRKRRRPQPTPRHPESRPTLPASESANAEGPGGPGGRRGAGLSDRDPQWPRGSQDSQEGGVRGEAERHGPGAGERRGREFTSLFIRSSQEHSKSHTHSCLRPSLRTCFLIKCHLQRNHS